MKIYIHTVTEELIANNGITLRAIPKFCEMERWENLGKDTLTIAPIHKFVHRTDFVVENLLFSDAKKENGDPYASFAELWDALTPYFTTA